MHGTNRCEGKNRKVWPFFASARLRLWRWLESAAAVLLVSCLVAEVRGQTPKAADFPELAAAYRPVHRFVSGMDILVGEGDPRSTDDSRRSGDPISAEARIPTQLPLKEFYSEYCRLHKKAISPMKALAFLAQYPWHEIPSLIAKTMWWYKRLAMTHLDYGDTAGPPTGASQA